MGINTKNQQILFILLLSSYVYINLLVFLPQIIQIKWSRNYKISVFRNYYFVHDNDKVKQVIHIF